MLDPSTRPEERARALDAVSSYRLDLMEKLRDREYHIVFRDDMPVNVSGLHVEKKREIHINRKCACTDQKRVLLHEMAHALDFQVQRDQKSWVGRLAGPARSYASQDDPVLEKLYRQYELRSSVDVAAHARDETAKHPGMEYVAHRYYTRTTEDRVIPADKAPDGREVVVETTDPGDCGKAKYVVPLVLAGLQAAGTVALTLAAVAPVLAPILAVGTAVGLYSAWAGSREVKEERRFDVMSGDVPLPDGTTRHVSRDEEKGVLETPPAGHRDLHMWSEYATGARKLHEYFAEGVSYYLASPRLREQLQQMDPDMYGYIAGLRLDEGAASPPASQPAQQ